MVKKRKDDGRSKKAPVLAFDLNFISETDLKKYVIKLKTELALMRKDSAFYSVNKNQILKFLEIRRDIYLSNKKASVVKNSAIDNVIEQLRRFPESFNEKLIINDSEKVKTKLENSFHDFRVRCLSNADHLNEEYVLEENIGEKSKQIEFDQFVSKMNMLSVEESFWNAREELDKKNSKRMKDLLKQAVAEILQTRREFNADKIRKLASIWDTHALPKASENSYVSEMERIEDYFQQIFANNSEVIKMLRDKLQKLITEKKTISFSLRQVREENMKLQEMQTGGFQPVGFLSTPARIPRTRNDILTEKKLEKLQFRNEVLKAQSKVAKERLQKLQKQFIGAVREIYQNADFKTCLLEELMKMNLLLESGELEQEINQSSSERLYREQKATDVVDIMNIFSLRVENSDTLFVPPVYHEFWEPSVKKQLRKIC